MRMTSTRFEGPGFEGYEFGYTELSKIYPNQFSDSLRDVFGLLFIAYRDTARILGKELRREIRW